MTIFKTAPATMARTLRVLAPLLSYPDAELRAHLPEMRDALHDERALRLGAAGRTRRADRAACARPRPLDVEADYVELFDRGRGTALHLFEHVHGDSRDRGPAMVDLAKTYEQAGLLLAPGELPDYLPRGAGVRLDAAAARRRATSWARSRTSCNVIFSALLRARKRLRQRARRRCSSWPARRRRPSSCPPSPRSTRAGTSRSAFDGCSTEGQARPGQPQPIQHRQARRQPARHQEPAHERLPCTTSSSASTRTSAWRCS